MWHLPETPAAGMLCWAQSLPKGAFSRHYLTAHKKDRTLTQQSTAVFGDD